MAFLKIKYNYIKQYLTVKSTKANKKLTSFLEATKKELNTFFNFEINEPLLFFIDQRKELDLIWGKKTEKWFVGAAKNNNIYIFNPNVYARESTYKKEKFWETLKHEYCHIYYSQITKSYYPFWLNEGLASYVSGKKLAVKRDDKDKLLGVFKYYDKMDKGCYLVGQFWVEYLIKKFGKKRLVKLIKSMPGGMNKNKFAEVFNEIYGIKFNKKTFIELLN
ncbi:MAG: hypothetical protein WC862_05750 [Patescibacteria group bacterium]